MKRAYLLALVGFTCAMVSPAQAVNLLLNGSFDLPEVVGCTPFNQGFPDDWTGNGTRNGSFYIPPCPRDGDDSHWSFSAQGLSSGGLIHQTVSGLSTGTTYSFSGLWFIGKQEPSTFQTMTGTAELRDGTTPDAPLLASTSLVLSQAGDTTDWIPFIVNGAPTGTDLTVVVRGVFSGSSNRGYAIHADNCVLEEATCLAPLSVSNVTPTYGARGESVAATVEGSNFVPGSTQVILRRPNEPDIVGTDVNVAGDGSSLTCDFDLTGGASALWNIVVSVAGSGCPDATLPSAFNLVLPAFTNGSFENPDPGNAGCSDSTTNGPPDDWRFVEIGSYGFVDALLRDSDQAPPSCPPVDGDHYASTLSGAAATDFGNNRVFQTFKVTPGVEYTVSGFFAGTGNNQVTLSLLNGDDSGLNAGTNSNIHFLGGVYPWTFGFATGTPSVSSNNPNGDLLTVEWKVQLFGNPPHAAHADNLMVSQCLNPITVSSITPNEGVNNGALIGASIAGTGFSDAAGIPQALLVGPGGAFQGANVVVVGPTEITCDFDLSGATSGFYDVVVFQEGCVGLDDEGFLNLADQLLNGDFEDPATEFACGVQRVGGSGWLFERDWHRDNGIWLPTCPRDVPSPIPPEGYGHYGSMSTNTTTAQRGYQFLAVTPGIQYRFGGFFAGGTGTDGSPTTTQIRLIDGADPAGSNVLGTTVIDDASGTQYDWTEAEVLGTATSNKMTVVWEMTGTDPGAGNDQPDATHADGLAFGPVASCNLPRSDVAPIPEGDGSVDQLDFAWLQKCFIDTSIDDLAGLAAAEKEICRCLDLAAPADIINLADFQEFVSCATGPTVQWAPTVDCAD